MNKRIVGAFVVSLILFGCGTMDDKTILINVGDSKDKVTNILGVPQDRQLKYQSEAWQYCVSGAGFGYNDHKIIWFEDSKVIGITSYRSNRSGCEGAIKTVNWEEAPDVIIEARER